MSRDASFSDLPEDTMLLVNRVCNRYEQTWQTGERPRLEAFVTDLDAHRRRAALLELVPLEIEYRRLAGETVTAADYQRRFPDLDAAWLAQLCRPEPANVTRGTSREPPDSGAIRTPPAPPAKPRKTQRLGDYELLAKLGGGGMGTVYKAMHQRMQRLVALKVLRADLKNRPELQARFEREVRTAARLSHPNIVTAYDAREDKGFHYLITEFIDGDDFDRLVKQRGPLPATQAINYVIQAAKGLAYAHQRQVIHRDIKPANLLLDRFGVVKILDMGLARLADENEWSNALNPTLTTSGMIMGTAAFMAPEQARDTRNADERSDIYALGCTLYFLLMGRPPYSGATALEQILAHTNAEIPDLKAPEGCEPFPEPLGEVFRRMVAKRPEDRFQQMGEVVDALEPLLLSAPTVAGMGDMATVLRTPVPSRGVHRSKRRKPSSRPLVIAGIGFLATTAALAAIWFGRFHSPPDLVKEPRPEKTVPEKADPEEKRPVNANDAPAIPRPPAPAPTPILASERTAARRCLLFNGQNSYVSVPSLRLDRSAAVTLEAVVQVRTRRISNVVSWLGPDWMALFQSSDGNWGIARRVGDGSRLQVADGSVTTDRWVHLAATVDQVNLVLFVDGQRLETRELKYEMPETDGGLFIGGVRPDLLPGDQNDRFFDGWIDVVRISHGRRYAEAFSPASRLNSDGATVALYNFDAGSGALATDDSGHGYHGEIVNATWETKTDG